MRADEKPQRLCLVAELGRAVVMAQRKHLMVSSVDGKEMTGGFFVAAPLLTDSRPGRERPA